MVIGVYLVLWVSKQMYVVLRGSGVAYQELEYWHHIVEATTLLRTHHQYVLVLETQVGTYGVLVGGGIGWQYGDCVQFIHRNILRAFCDRLYTPLVKVEKAVGIVEMTALRKDGQLCVQLINGNGGHAGMDTATEDFIPPALDIALTIRLEKKPAALMLQPAGKALDFVWDDGKAIVTVDRIDIHEIVEVIE